MSEDLLKIIGVVVLVVFFLYLASKALKLHLNLQNSIMEGMTSTSSNGIAGSAATYATSISSQATQIQDSLLISKYKTDYENVILNMDDYISLLMMQTALNFSVNDGASANNMTLLTNLNTLNAAKQSLNSIMTFIDQQ